MIWPWKKQRHEPDNEHDELRNRVRKKVVDIHGHISMLDWNTEEEDGSNITADQRSLSEEWQEFVPGIECRLLDTGNVNMTVIQGRVLKPFTMERHWHHEGEITISVDLEMIDMETGKKAGPMESITFSGRERHHPKFLTTGNIIVIFSPKLQDG